MPNSNSVLVTKPNFDQATSYLSAWADLVIEEAKKRNLKVFELKGKQATRKLFEKRVKKNDPALIAFNGHGRNDRILGNKKEVLVKAGENERYLGSRIIHSLSCSSAKQLGPKSIKSGAKAFIGYIEKFVLLHDEKHSATPKKDKIAKHFLESANTVPISLIKGSTVKEACEKSQASFEKSIEYYKTHYTPENSHILFWLRYDKMIQKFSGKENATLETCSNQSTVH